MYIKYCPHENIGLEKKKTYNYILRFPSEINDKILFSRFGNRFKKKYFQAEMDGDTKSGWNTGDKCKMYRGSGECVKFRIKYRI